MSALPAPDFELHSPQELADLIATADTWREVEQLTAQYHEWKTAAWQLLTDAQQDRLRLLQKWQDYPVAQKFPPGAIVQRLDDAHDLTGEVKAYWQAYGEDYVTFMVGPDVDWCRASNLKRVSLPVETVRRSA
jgi:hypothetical protein